MKAPAEKAFPALPAALAGAAIVLAAILAYANTFQVPFLMDDLIGFRLLAAPKVGKSLGDLLLPHNSLAGGRPLLNLTFALNQAWSGPEVWSYHLVNLVIHASAGLALFGVAWRTGRLLRAANPGMSAGAPVAAGAFIALLWTVHPLQTEAVTYLSQRAESLMGLFYLVTLYGFIRSQQSAHPGRWLWLSAAACFCGMATKEVMVTAPFLVLLYDRTFVSRSFREAVAKRPVYYSALAASWILLAGLMCSPSAGARGVGIDAGVGWASYLLTESRVVVLYSKLALWPAPLVFDYGPDMLEREVLPVLPFALLLLAGLGAAVACYAWGRKVPGFAIASFFILLAPTSSFVPIAGQPMAESRMYLALAAVATLLTVGVGRAFGRSARYVLGALVIAFAALTVARNHDYRSAMAIWEDTVLKRPKNARAQNNLGIALKSTSRADEAIEHFKIALRLNPDYAEARFDLADTLLSSGHAAEAVTQFKLGLEIKPDASVAHCDLANALSALPGREVEAEASYRAALHLNPDFTDAHVNLGNLLLRKPGGTAEAISQYEAALRIDPGHLLAHYFLAGALSSQPESRDAAIAQYEAALRLRPDFLEGHVSLGNLLMDTPGHLAEAFAHGEAALRLNPNNEAARQLAARLGLTP